MFDLIADGPQPRQRCRYRLEPGTRYELGREIDADLPVPWDPWISRRHAMVQLENDELAVERIAAAGNPLYFQGEPLEACRLAAGQHFVLGGTIFAFERVSEAQSDVESPVEEMTFEPAELQKVRYRDADRRIEVLSRLPDVIWGARTEVELQHSVVELVLGGVIRAEAAAIVEMDRNDSTRLVHWDRRRQTAGEFRPSSRLVFDALRRKKRTVMHVWRGQKRTSRDYTEAADFDWAYCTPIPRPGLSSWGLYVAGKLEGLLSGSGSEGAGGLQADVKFTELVAEIVSNVQRLSRLEQQRSGLKQFFAPQVLSALGEDWNTDALKPRECDVTVLFCDLQGFSQKAEQAAGQLLTLLQRVSAALGVMTQHILAKGGVTADFLGDAALGFWGWPFPSDDAAVNACRAALAIRKTFDQINRQKDHPLADFRMGIGIAHGRAVAGKIGTTEQVKVTVFGPVVNLAARLQGMTRELRVPIVLDEATAEIIGSRLPLQEGRLRKLAKVQPFGMERAVTVSELLPAEADFSALTDHHLRQFELGVEKFIAGDWDAAYQLLHAMPASDRAQDFLSQRIMQTNRVAPAGWDGVVRLPGK